MTEVEAVKRLGDKIGYGNMMDIASALWANQLNSGYGLPINEVCGAFVPVCISIKETREEACSRKTA